MYVEAFHRVLKYIYMKGMHNKRIEKCIHLLVKLERDKTFERLIKLEKGKISGILTTIRKRHLASQKLSYSLLSTVDSNTWRVQSSTDLDKYYTVEKDKQECDGKCALKCQEWNVCVHMYCCNCNDAFVGHTICKHIHLVASSNQNSIDSSDVSFNQDYAPLLATLQTDVDDVSNMKNSIMKKLSLYCHLKYSRVKIYQH